MFETLFSEVNNEIIKTIGVVLVGVVIVFTKSLYRQILRLQLYVSRKCEERRHARLKKLAKLLWDLSMEDQVMNALEAVQHNNDREHERVRKDGARTLMILEGFLTDNKAENVEIRQALLEINQTQREIMRQLMAGVANKEAY
ncbi:MAG: hypothetical protein OEX12_00080 [Gammaproteobacteria bacterium]|nr:hypothetical protein [Gammaproteobacteria bacterium]